MKIKKLHKARAAGLLSLFLFVLCGISACQPSGGQSPALKTLAISGPTMGTRYHVKIVAPSKELPSEEQALAWSNSLFAEINQSMSTYIADSELSLLNHSSSESPAPLSDQLFQVLQLSQSISELSDGAFDISVGPLVNVWGFGPDERDDKAPSKEQVQALKMRVGYQKILLDAQQKTLVKPSNMVLDLSAIAKGYGADALAKLLRSKGYSNVMVEVGGELSVLGHNDRGEPWRIGIEKPNYELLSPASAMVGTVKISGVGMATSGDYRNYFEVDGQRFSHTIDPQTGYPITHNLASVTVIAQNCATADALATAFSVMGPEKTLALAERENIAAFIVVKDGDSFKTQHSSAFSAYIDQ